MRRDRQARVAAALVAIGVIVLGASCSTPQGTRDVESATEPIDSIAGLHNVLPIVKGIINGSRPEGDAGFDSLVEMGVKTVISVDGARPDAARADARGMRYVHIPIGYDGIDEETQLLLARALRDLPRPIYIHCHHGKHRGPTAAAVGLTLLGEINAEQAVDFMTRAKTSSSYEGLYACAAGAAAVHPRAIQMIEPEFTEYAAVSGLTASMAAIDDAWENLKVVRDAGWRVPRDHPDLVPAAEAGRLADLLSNLDDDEQVKAETDEFLFMLGQSAAMASALEEAIVNGASRPVLTKRVADLGASCKSCHVKYRDY